MSETERRAALRKYGIHRCYSERGEESREVGAVLCEQSENARATRDSSPSFSGRTPPGDMPDQDQTGGSLVALGGLPDDALVVVPDRL
jgi:hypothetical protein